MSISNFFNDIGKWRGDAEIFSKFLFYPTSDGSMSVQIQRFDARSGLLLEVSSFQSDFEFWMIGGHTIKWFSNLSYTTSHYGNDFFRDISNYLILVLDKEATLRAPSGFMLDPTQSKMPYVEVVVSKTTGGTQTLTYNVPAGKNGSQMELFMLGLTIRHLVMIYPQAHQLFLYGFGLLFQLHKQGYLLTDMERGSTSAAGVIEKVAEKILSDMRPEEE